MKTIDLHVDLPWQLFKAGTECYDDLPDISKNQDWLQIDLPKMKKGNLDTVVAALYLSDWRQDTLGPEDSFIWIKNQAIWIKSFGTDYGLDYKLALEGGRLIDCNLGWLDELADMGIVYMTLTHNKTTDWADSATDVMKHNGLTAFGKRVIKNLEIHRILPDVSHTSDDTAFDTLNTAVGPVVATHSGVRNRINHPRNLSDTLIRRIVESGGLVGVPFATRFVGDKAGVVVAIDHIAQITGTTSGVAIGSDLDGAQTVIKDASEWDFWMEPLNKMGYADGDIMRIAGGNFTTLVDNWRK